MKAFAFLLHGTHWLLVTDVAGQQRSTNPRRAKAATTPQSKPSKYPSKLTVHLTHGHFKPYQNLITLNINFMSTIYVYYYSQIFIDIKSFRSHYGPGVDSASNRNEYQEYFLGVKSGRCARLTTYHHPVPLSQNLGALTSWNPLGLSRPVMGLLYLLLFTKADCFTFYYSQRQFSKRIPDINFMVHRINLRLIKEIQIFIMHERRAN